MLVFYFTTNQMNHSFPRWRPLQFTYHKRISLVIAQIIFPIGCVLKVGSRVFTFFRGVLQILGPLPSFWLDLHPFLGLGQLRGRQCNCQHKYRNLDLGSIQSSQLIKFILNFQHTQAFSSDRCLYLLSIHVEIN